MDDWQDDAAADIFDALYSSAEYCSWCFARRKTLHEAYDEATADHFRARNWAAFDALGHRIHFDEDADRALDVNTSSSTPDPATETDDVPGTVIETETEDGDVERERKRPARKTVCECGVIDINYHDARPTALMFDAATNIAAAAARRGVALDVETMHEEIVALRRDDDNAGKDRKVLVAAIAAGRDAR